VAEVDPKGVIRFVKGPKKGQPEEGVPELPEEEWKRRLSTVLTEKLDPPAFERLVQRLLRESGFSQVEVTGRSGDGGIDGRGIARIH